MGKVITAYMTVVCLTNAQSVERICQGVPNGQFALSPRSHQHWLFCQNNAVAGEGQCPDTSYFDLTLQMCSPCTTDHRSANLAEVCLTSAQSLDRFCEGIPNYQNVWSPRSCQHFLQCRNNVVVSEGQCLTNFYFDQKRNGCNYPKEAECNFDNPRQSPLTCATGSPQKGHNWFNCDQYTQCFNGTARIFNCPEGLWWDQQSGSCQLPANSDCPGMNPLPISCAAGQTYVTHHAWATCDGYVFCLNGTARIVDCQDGFSFDEVSGRCQLSRIATCPSS